MGFPIVRSFLQRAISSNDDHGRTVGTLHGNVSQVYAQAAPVVCLCPQSKLPKRRREGRRAANITPGKMVKFFSDVYLKPPVGDIE